MPFSSSKKILWAIDPFAEKGPQLQTAAFIQALTRGQSISVEPVTVLSPDQLRIPPQAFAPHQKEHLLESESTLRGWLKEIAWKDLAEPRLLVSTNYSRKDSTDTLINYAQKEKAALITVNTQAKKGFIRAFLGSFAENLALYSKTPLFIVNPAAKPVKHFKEILFATDLSDESKDTFKEVLSLAKAIEAKVTLFHKIDYLTESTYFAITKNVNYEKYLEQDVAAKTKQMDHLLAQAKKEGVEVNAVIDRSPIFLVEAILKKAHKMDSAMIAMQSSVTPGAAAFVGSVARQVIREAECPVWVLHQPKKK